MSQFDHSMFVRHSTSSIIIVLVYVDDILVTGYDKKFIMDLRELNNQFVMRLLGPLKQFFGSDVTYYSSNITLSQQGYKLKVLKKVSMSSSKPNSIPMAAKKFLLSDDLEYDNPYFYKSLVGALQYITNTRPELTFATNTTCQHIHKPHLSHVQALKKILRYLAGSANLSLHYTKISLHLHGYSDADWAGDTSNRKSTSGYCVYMGNNPIMWSSCKQTTVSCSSTEAKYRALASTAAELCWIRMMFTKLRLPLSSTH